MKKELHCVICGAKISYKFGRPRRHARILNAKKRFKSLRLTLLCWIWRSI